MKKGIFFVFPETDYLTLSALKFLVIESESFVRFVKKIVVKKEAEEKQSKIKTVREVEKPYAGKSMKASAVDVFKRFGPELSYREVYCRLQKGGYDGWTRARTKKDKLISLHTRLDEAVAQGTLEKVEGKEGRYRLPGNTIPSIN